MGAYEVAASVFGPGTPGTDTSARLVTQVTVTDTEPPATKFDVLVMTWGDGHVSPALPNVLATAADSLGLGVVGVVLDHGGLDAGPSGGLDVALGRVDPSRG